MYLKFLFLLPCICQSEHVNFFDKIMKDNRAAPSTGKESLDNIRSDLGECRQRNLQLTNTVDYILEEMTDMEKRMTRNEKSISEVKSTFEKYSNQNTNLEEDLVTAVENNIERLDSLSYWGRWCAYKSSWVRDDSTITYEKLLTADNNMNANSPMILHIGIASFFSYYVIYNSLYHFQEHLWFQGPAPGK